jgi:anti-sigma regulatory factor (Ser/Thr protein kinase)
MFGYSPTSGTAAAMDALDAWPGSPAFFTGPYVEPSLELGMPSAWSTTTSVPAAEGVLGELDLAATPAAVRLARSYVRELVGECLAPSKSVLDDLELLTSEVVTNSVLHARPRRDGTVMLAALHTGRTVRVEVTDGGPRAGTRPPANDPLPVSGRGLRLVEAIAFDHGRYRDSAGSATFWFEVAIGGDRPDVVDDDDRLG